jgi:hypothetical protein
MTQSLAACGMDLEGQRGAEQQCTAARCEAAESKNLAEVSKSWRSRNLTAFAGACLTIAPGPNEQKATVEISSGSFIR